MVKTEEMVKTKEMKKVLGTKKVKKAMALGLILAMGITAVGSFSPKATAESRPATGSEVAGKSVAPSKSVNAFDEDQPKTAPGAEVPWEDATQSTDDWQLDGGWVVAEDHTVTDKVREMVHDSFLHVVGVRNKPIAYLGYQVVAGTNHCILCKRSPVIPNPIYSYVLLYVYEDLEGNYRITSHRQIDISKFMEYVDPTELTDLTLNKTSIKIKKGKKAKLKTTITYGTEEKPVLIWKSWNKKIATVKNGVITAKKKGTCTITCQIKGLPDTLRMCYVSVKKK